jgi:hypothetical protein
MVKKYYLNCLLNLLRINTRTDAHLNDAANEKNSESSSIVIENNYKFIYETIDIF